MTDSTQRQSETLLENLDQFFSTILELLEPGDDHEIRVTFAWCLLKRQRAKLLANNDDPTLSQEEIDERLRLLQPLLDVVEELKDKAIRVLGINGNVEESGRGEEVEEGKAEKEAAQVEARAGMKEDGDTKRLENWDDAIDALFSGKI